MSMKLGNQDQSRAKDKVDKMSESSENFMEMGGETSAAEPKLLAEDVLPHRRPQHNGKPCDDEDGCGEEAPPMPKKGEKWEGSVYAPWAHICPRRGTCIEQISVL